jgi:SulP family sulfate permease
VLILIILIFAPLAAYIPFCVLAAILFVVAYNMSDVPEFMHLLKHAPYYDRIILLTTFLLTIFIDLVIAVGVGVILGMLFFTLRMYQSIYIGQTKPEFSSAHLGTDEILIYDLNGPFFFGAAEKIEQAFAITHTDPKVIIYNFKNVPFIDMTGLETFSNIVEQYKKRGVLVFICQANSVVANKLKIIPELQKNSHIFFSTIDEALNFYHKK